jgi:hexokinase
MTEIKNKVRRFLKDNDMCYEDIDMDECCDIFIKEMLRGLEGAASSLAMIPTYIEVGKDIPSGKPVIVLDAGGTNFRVATVTFNEKGKPVVENFVQEVMPGLDKEVSKEEFFGAIAEYMTDVVDVSGNVGFCFSYPTEILPSKDGRLIRFCKEVKAKEVEGELIGENLVSAVKAAGYQGNKRIVILNDTVATLLAGMSAFPDRVFDSYIGFILGTGSNCCYIESNKNIPKKPDLAAEKQQIINIESGSFGKAPRGTIDLKLDESTLDPGRYTFEKMFSGAYLGPLCLRTIRKAAGQGLFSKKTTEAFFAIEDFGTKELNSFLRNPQGDNILAAACKRGGEEDYAGVWHVLDGLIERAAKLTAMLLSSAVLKTNKGRNPCKPVCVTAEGTTFYELKSLRQKVEFYLKDFLEERHNRFVEIVSVDNATLIGAAIAGLTN